MLRLSAVAAGITSYSLLQHNSRAGCAREPEYEPVKPIRCQDGQRIIPYAPPPRSENLQKLKSQKFDVLVIGGGSVGAGVALDAAHKGLKTALIERDDFSAGTSGRSTKLIHGGIRYLETAFKKLDYGSYQLVKEALEERAYMLNAAPYMNHPLPIMMPIYHYWEIPYYWVGTKVYDWVARKHKAVPSSHYLSKDEALFQFPMLKTEHLKGAIVYYDGQMNDTRMALTVVLTATQLGAVAANRVELVTLLKDEAGKVRGAHVRDTITGEEWDVHADAVVNATGAFVDHIRKMDNPGAPELVIPSAGVHIMLEDHFSPAKMGLIIPKTKDGRVLFFLPWENATLAGTTDSATDLTMLPAPTDQEVDFILQEANRVLDKRVKRSDVKSAWSGIRPLVRDPTKLSQGTKALSRNHVIEVSDSGLVTVTGGKWTTYRRMAEDTMKRLFKEQPQLEEACDASKSTLNVAMVGADRAGMVCAKKFDNIMVTLRSEYNLPRDVAKHLVFNYGTRALQIAEIARSGFGPDRTGGTGPRLLSPKYPFIEAEVVFAMRHEYALKATDILARRTRLAFIDVETARQVTPRVIQIMAHHLGWSKARCEQEAAEVEELLHTMSKKGGSNSSSKL